MPIEVVYDWECPVSKRNALSILAWNVPRALRMDIRGTDGRENCRIHAQLENRI